MEFEESDVFDRDKIKEAVKDAVKEGMGKSHPNPKLIKEWSLKVGEGCQEKIARMKTPFKYLVFTNIMEDNGAGYHFYLSAMWDRDKDNYLSYQEKRPSQHVWLDVNVIGVSI